MSCTVLVVVPTVLIFAITQFAMDDGQDAFHTALGLMYFLLSPITFGLTVFMHAARASDLLKDAVFTLFRDEDEIEVTLPLYVVVILCQALFFILLNVVIDSLRMNSFKSKKGGKGDSHPEVEIAQNVRDHEAEVLHAFNEGNGRDFNLIARDLNKTYKKSKFKSVDNTTFGIKPGQVFGILGPNGAGKSTTFNMLTM